MHNDNIINLLKLEGVNFERLEENEKSILLFLVYNHFKSTT